MGKGARLRRERTQNRAVAAELLQMPEIRKAFEHEVGKRLKDLHLVLCRNDLLVVCLALHRAFGFGPVRLKRFCAACNDAWKNMPEYYELGDLSAPTLAEIELRQAGIDMDEVLREVLPDAQDV
jgi:hypothetical protein